MALYGQGNFQTGSPTQLIAWLEETPSAELSTLASKVKARRTADLPIVRSDLDRWVRECTKNRSRDDQINVKPHLPKTPRKSQPGQGQRGDAYTPPQVGAKDHKTLRDRLQYQQRGLHLPYVRAAAYGQKVPSNLWTRAELRAHDDPYELTSGDGMTINQDGLWTIIVKTDWSVGHAEVVVGAAQATRLMINGSDAGLRDYLDDDAYTAQLPINTFLWTDEFRAGTVLNVDVRSEGLGANFSAVCNVYIRAYLVRCHDGEFDMVGFPLPPNPEPDRPKQPKIPNPPLKGYTPTVPSQPARPQNPGTCRDFDYQYGVTVNDAGQVGYYKCSGGELTTQWSSYGWDGGIYFGGGSTGASVGGPGAFPGQW